MISPANGHIHEQADDSANELQPSLEDTVLAKSVAALSLGAFVSAISQRVTDPLLPRLASEFGVALGSAAWVVNCFTLGYALCQLLFGPIGARYGKYLVVAWIRVASGIVLSASGVVLVALNSAHRKRRL